MSALLEWEIIGLLRCEIEPVVDVYSRRAYRAAAHLTDSIYLPCVTVKPSLDIVELAVRRLAETEDREDRAPLTATIALC